MLTVEQQLDELTAKVDKLSTSVEFANTGVASLTKNVSKLTDTVTTVLDKVNIVDQWSKDADKPAGDLETVMLKLTSRVQALEQAPNTALPLVPSREEGGRASGHGTSSTYQGVLLGESSLQATLVKGEHKHSQSPPLVLHTDHHASKMSQFEDENRGHYHSKGLTRDFRMPRIDFPKFEGEHPKIWKEKCEKYFKMCGVPQDMWAPFATMHFHSHAAYWLQTFEAQHAHYSWAELFVAVDAKFGKEMYHNYMRELLAIKQTSDVTEYHARFVDVMHKVMLHHPGHDEVLFVQKFIDGLKHDISSAIMLHKPRTVDTAMSVAVM
jgi:hypothetical protein